MLIDCKKTGPNNPEGIQYYDVTNELSLIPEAIKLLHEYGDYMYNNLGLTAGKESFFKQLIYFPGKDYLPPAGMFVIAKKDNVFIGCVGIKKFDNDSCEMKRMYINPAFRGRSIGKSLCNYVIEWCRSSTYKRILLDTNVEMKEAVSLYYKCEFKKIDPYCINENDHPVFMEYVL